MVECHNLCRGLARGTIMTRDITEIINSVHTLLYRCEPGRAMLAAMLGFSGKNYRANATRQRLTKLSWFWILSNEFLPTFSMRCETF